jgi:integrase
MDKKEELAMKTTEAVKITNAFLKKLEVGEKAKYVDTEIQGFQVVVGAKTIAFYVHKKVKQKIHRVSIGKYPLVSLEEARQEALKILSSLANYQIPEAIIERKQPTLNEAMEFYLTQVKNKKCVKSAFIHFSHLKHKTISNITCDDIASVHKRMHKTPAAANNAVKYISAAISKITRKLALDINNPTRNIKLYPRTKRKRFLSETEAPKIITALQKLQKSKRHAVQADALLVMVYTGARKSNVLQMNINEIERNIWTIPEEKAKAGKEIVVPLNEAALEIIEKRRKNAVKGQLFCYHGKVLKDVRKTFSRACDMADVENCHVHDLRRTLGSWMLMTGTPIEIVSKTLGHSSIRVTEQVYAHLLPGKISDATSLAIKAMKAGKA